VINGEGSVIIDELPLGEYRVEELINNGYIVTLEPEDGIVDLTTAENNTVTVIITNTPRPVLIIEKILLDEAEEQIAESDVQFTVILDGGLFEEEEITFSVNEPALLDYTDGLEFEVLYTVTEVSDENYTFISIDPDEAFLITDENNEVTVTVINQVPETPFIPPQTIPNPPVVFFLPPDPPESIPEETEIEPEEDEVTIEPEEPETEEPEPEEPEPEPEEEELVISPEAPLATPQTGGASLALAALGLTLISSGILLKGHKVK